uniref:PDZ domain-containing protein n=1 Tax=Ascaris lumbricoides TaxID=6252 RepID=A0A9J2PXX4_ASCLU
MATAATESSSEPQARPRPNRSKFWGEARTVILHREPNQSFGISIVGGRVEVSQKGGLPGTGNTVSGIFIKSVLPNSPAGKSGMMNMGDRVISVRISIVGGRVEVSQKGGLPGTGNTVSGIFIKSVLPNSPAGKSGMMNMGDRVISVNDYDLREATHEQAVHRIKNATNPVKFVVQSLHCFSPQHMVSFGDTTRKEHAESREKSETDADSKETSPKKSAPQPHPSDYANANVIIEKHLIRQEEVIPEQVVVEQSVEALSVEESSAKEGTASDKESGVRLSSERHEATPPPASEVPQTSNAYEEAKESVPKAATVESSKTKPAAEKRDDDREAERAKIERGSAAYLTRLPDDPEEEDRFFYTKDKIARKYGDFPGDAILLRLEKVPPGGLGLSLAGNRDRDKMSVFVVAIRSTCPLPIKIGDELLEVNGKVLLGLSHLNASAKIRECCEEGKLDLLLLRRFDALDEMAIRPEPKLSRSQTSPVCAESAAVDATYIPGKRQTSVETKEQPSKTFIVNIELKTYSRHLFQVNGKVLLGLSHLNASAKIRECCEEGKLDLLLLRRFDALDEMAIRPEPKLSRSQTSPVCAESAAVDATYIPGKRQTSVETKEQPSKTNLLARKAAVIMLIYGRLQASVFGKVKVRDGECGGDVPEI